jgi:hypothetical protein
MGYKKGCGFREKVNVCGFKKEDCNSKECDMFDIEFTAKEILKKSKQERKEIIDLTMKMKEMKKNHEHKTNPEEFKKIKSLRKDKVIGMIKLSKAYNFCKRTRT